jgi:hypothetical protein
MSSAPPPPPPWLPPPPPPTFAPLGSIVPVGPPLPPPPPGGWAFRPTPIAELLAHIHSGIRWYLAALVLNLVAGAVSAALLGYIVGGVFSGGSVTTGATTTVSTGVSDVLGLLGFLLLLLTVVAWVKWRSGVLYLPEAAVEYGVGYGLSAQSARKEYSRSLWSFLTILIGSFVFAIALAGYVVSKVASACAQAAANNTTCATAGSGLSGTGLAEATLAFGLFAAVFEFLMYYFASRSLVDAIRPLCPSEGQGRLDRGRLAMVVGAALTPIGLLNAGLTILGTSFLPLAFAGLVTPVLLLYGLYEIDRAYSGWLEAPRRGTGPSAVPAGPYSWPPRP